MVQGVNKEYIFDKECYIKKYLEFIDLNAKKLKVDVLAYCVMNNHAHFLMYTSNLDLLGKLMHSVNLQFSNYYNKGENRCGVLFRNRYKSEPISDRRYLVNCIKYIHNNPVKAKIVEKCEDYKFSSYKEYITGRNITKKKIIKELFGENCNYIKLFGDAKDKRFLDTRDDCENFSSYYLKTAICEFLDIKSERMSTLLSNKQLFGDFVSFLKYKCGFKYTEIQRFFGINKGAMDTFRSFHYKA